MNGTVPAPAVLIVDPNWIGPIIPLGQTVGSALAV